MKKKLEDNNIPNVSYKVYHFQMSEEKQIALAMLEEELGIDLITLFKAMTSGFYYKGISNHGVEFIGFAVMRNINKTYTRVSHRNYHFKDYGLTWALTKEELE